MIDQDPVPPVAYSLKDAAAAVGLSEGYLRRQMHAGHLRGRLIGRKYFVSRLDLQAWFDSQPEA